MRDFLEFVYPRYGWLEIRPIRKGEVRQYFTTDINDAERWAKELDLDGWDVYVGVLPRRSASGRSEDVWPSASILWADLDDKDYGDHGTTLESLLKFPVTPSAIIDSGHGLHAYFRLWEPVDTSDAVETNQAIARWLGADNCFDAPRILRVPGTHNHKDPENPIPVRVLKLDTLRRYDLSDFNEMVESLRSTALREHIPQTERRGDAPDWLKDGLNTEPPKGTRSEEEFRLGVWLARYGYTDDQIFDALMNMPFGAKAQERGERWAAQEVARIRRKA